jgi:hypothetical protein
MRLAICATKLRRQTLGPCREIRESGFHHRSLEQLFPPKLHPMMEELYDFRTAPIRR